MPPTVQVRAETLRSWMVVQAVPAAPSLPWTDPSSAEASQRSAAGRSRGGAAVEGGVVVVGGVGDRGGAAVGGGGAAAGWVAVVRAEQPVTAIAAVQMMVAMILAGRMASPPEQARPDLGPGHQPGLGRSRPDDGRAPRPTRNDLDQVAIVNQNKHAGQDGQGFPQQVVRQASNDPGDGPRVVRLRGALTPDVALRGARRNCIVT
jgi:hypothetical protein